MYKRISHAIQSRHFLHGRNKQELEINITKKYKQEHNKMLVLNSRTSTAKSIRRHSKKKHQPGGVSIIAKRKWHRNQYDTRMTT